MKLRHGDAWMPAPAYGRELSEMRTGLSINLLVADIARAVEFQTQVLGASVLYSDPDFVAVAGFGAQWCLHADHTYDKHPLSGIAGRETGRGAGAELRLFGCDPDRAEHAAQEHGFTVLAGSIDKPHGLRETYLLDAEGYCWVPSVAVPHDP
jgi:catechol 2,3-dioxygenase-like lactoylglutathione lyase family enzyme